MSQSPTLESPMDTAAGQGAINANNSHGGQGMDVKHELGAPSRLTTDKIWMTIVTSFSVVLLGSFIVLAVAALFYGKLPGDLLLTVFTTSAAFLAGLLAPSPTQAKSS